MDVADYYDYIWPFIRKYLADEALTLSNLRNQRDPEAVDREHRLDNMEIIYDALVRRSGWSTLSQPDKAWTASYLAQEIGLQFIAPVISGTS